MKKFITATIGVLALSILGLSLEAQAGSVTARLSGFQAAQENSCVSPIWFFVGLDCSYNGSFPFLWVGPHAGHPIYYAPGNSPGPGVAVFVRPFGDSLAISGAVTVDDSGTPGGADDMISGTWTIAAGARIACVGMMACENEAVEESWTSITHTMAPTVVDSATSNAEGGFDYTISSHPAGPPAALSPFGLNTSPYPSPIPSFIPPVIHWVAPAPRFQSVASFECQRTLFLPDFPCDASLGPDNVNSIGATTTATAVGYQCTDVGTGRCNAGPDTNLIGKAGTFGYENVQIALSTDARGAITSATAFYTHEYLTLPFFLAPKDSWDGGALTFSSHVLSVAAKAKRDAANDVQVGKNKFPVTIFTTDTFDATTLDEGSLAVGSGGIVHKAFHIADIDLDGRDDVSAHFSSDHAEIVCGPQTLHLNASIGGIEYLGSFDVNGVGKGCP